MEEKEFSSINVIPLVDIMLVLLTIVLTTATFIVQGSIPVSLPEAQSGEPIKEVSELVITVTEDGSVYLEGKLVSLEELEQKLASLDPRTPVRLRVDERARVGALVKLLDLLQRRGFNNLSLTVKLS
ncbi:MAG: biopolymer transporter ExbD [Aquificae bacterium]|nr:biopolymer transporter ExbD [Aquificota bacterium]